jgi:hypothetical protein
MPRGLILSVTAAILLNAGWPTERATGAIDRQQGSHPGPQNGLTLGIADYAALPITGRLDGTGQTDGLLARVSVIRDEPGDARRFFVVDLNGPLYILDQRTRRWTTYLDFNGRGGRKGLFKRLSYDVGFANGLNTMQFDPDYRRNGRFYTVHTEDPTVDASGVPDNSTFAGLTTAGYATTTPIITPGPVVRESVLIEWTDTNLANNTFEGSAREVMRVQLNSRVHPMGDLTFNPRAKRGEADWRVMYIGCGDGGSGEVAQPDIQPATTGYARRQNPPDRSRPCGARLHERVE